MPLTLMCDAPGGWVLSSEGQALATWIYTAVTFAALLGIYKQVVAMRQARDLEAFKTFQQLWEDEEVSRGRNQRTIDLVSA